MAQSGFTRKKVSSLTLGEKLQKLRTQRRMSLSEISKNTKIQLKYLEALEKGDYSVLPADVYVKGFLRQYAYYIGVNEQSFLKLYDRERGIHDNMQGHTKDSHSTGKNHYTHQRFVITPKIIITALSIFLVCAGIFYIYTEFDRFVSSPWLVISEPQDGITITSSSVPVVGSTEKNTHIFINDQQVVVDQEGKFVEAIGLQVGANTITVRSVNRFDKETQQTLTIYAHYATLDSTQSEVDEVQEKIYEGVQVDVYSENKEVWLSIDADDVNIYNTKIPAGAIQTFEASEKITITSGIGNETFVRVNGRAFGFLSKEASVVRDVTFTPDTQFDSVEDLIETGDSSGAEESSEVSSRQEEKP